MGELDGSQLSACVADSEFGGNGGQYFFRSMLTNPLERAKGGAVRVSNPSLLLDAWAEAYDFDKHMILRGHVSAGATEVLLPRMQKAFDNGKLRHATTGLAAARLYTQFAGFRLVTVFVEKRPPDALLREVGFREEPRGANVWLVVPNDEGVFDGAKKQQGVDCAHPVQVYLDLQAHPERAQEAAAELRARLLKWKR